MKLQRQVVFSFSRVLPDDSEMAPYVENAMKWFADWSHDRPLGADGTAVAPNNVIIQWGARARQVQTNGEFQVAAARGVMAAEGQTSDENTQS